jgi:hypothetical protein
MHNSSNTVWDLEQVLCAAVDRGCRGVFWNSVAETVVSVKMILRAECLVVSFHEDEAEADEHRS